MNDDIIKNLTIENAAAAASELLKEIKGGKENIVDLSGVEKLDLAGIQLLVSAQKTGEKGKGTFYFKGPLKKPLFDKLANNGFNLIHSEKDDELFTIRRSSGEF